jgi:polar amino acid transport system substrate-binding protein
LLKYAASDEFANRIEVLPLLFNVHEYAIALPVGSRLRTPLNEQLLRFRESDAWSQLVFRFPGE